MTGGGKALLLRQLYIVSALWSVFSKIVRSVQPINGIWEDGETYPLGLASP